MSTEISTLNGHPLADTSARDLIKTAPAAIDVAAITGGNRITITYNDGSTKTVDVMDGENGTDGQPGKDGVSVTHSWDGTILSVTSASGTSSADLGGENGEPGYTPQRGVDYYTEADQEEIVQQVITALGTPVFGRVEADNTVILTGNLANGEYTIKYENADGSLTDIGTLSFVTVSYTNLADQTSADWLVDKRINSSGVLKDASGVDITNFIQIDANVQKIHIKGLDIVSALPTGENYGRVYAYDANKTYVDYKQPSIMSDYVYPADYDNTVYIVDMAAMRNSVEYNSVTGAAFLRFGGIPTADEIIITANEPIE